MSEGASGSATVVTSQKVREGLDDEYRRWQEKMNQVVRHFDGFAGTETYPPGPPGSGEERQWVVVFRFSDMDQLTAWLDSTTREELLTEGRPLLEGSPRQEVLAGSEPAVPDREEGVTAVISHDVRQGKEEDFEHWQTKSVSHVAGWVSFL
ncbi:hypothetical protein [Streptomyces scabiei]|uniref:hypothetical protein n=1 Tax=Streptomyces scabiei TaxID=1930 RepID=UPI001F25425D|nr:hypothetical protein [Streptomyces scabiei]